ncbi:LPS export ABC transporter periplasmic protein LptC [Massilia oculi]|uniref:LPS export ABC transporter periplasmic protein LptC n=1 Tax=Massilia hydrophila TaxID=3044279 RepID=A0ABS7Y8W6_9BURK|nr:MULTISPECIES: LPS export ABC transporter periplasmic protein LptC [Massilia]MCA1247460.1 LPS export ABC transporter periplasmic protein LptC [Massilia sp. MS-15]MCA1856142.1 LPS export ABC transporter periplasmic protein LptC [Massilia oculi]
MVNYKRTAHRWKLLAIMMIATFCAFGSFWLVQLMDDEDRDARLGGPLDEPDYIVENFSFVRMTPEGKPNYVVSGRRMAHTPQGDVSRVEAPVLEGMAPGRPRMTIVASRAEIYHEEHRVELLGKVDIQRPATPTSEALRVRTEALTVLPDEEILRTRLPIEMQLGAATVHGTGMEANNATQKLHLASRGQIVYPPRAR